MSTAYWIECKTCGKIFWGCPEAVGGPTQMRRLRFVWQLRRHIIAFHKAQEALAGKDPGDAGAWLTFQDEAGRLIDWEWLRRHSRHTVVIKDEYGNSYPINEPVKET